MRVRVCVWLSLGWRDDFEAGICIGLAVVGLLHVSRAYALPECVRRGPQLVSCAKLRLQQL